MNNHKNGGNRLFSNSLSRSLKVNFLWINFSKKGNALSRINFDIKKFKRTVVFFNVTFYEILTILILAPKNLVFDQIQLDNFYLIARINSFYLEFG